MPDIHDIGSFIASDTGLEIVVFLMCAIGFALGFIRTRIFAHLIIAIILLGPYGLAKSHYLGQFGVDSWDMADWALYRWFPICAVTLFFGHVVHWAFFGPRVYLRSLYDPFLPTRLWRTDLVFSADTRRPVTSKVPKPYKTTPVFDQDSLPEALRNHHNTKAGVWGILRVLEGEVALVYEDPPTRTVHNPDTPGLIRPEARHYVELLGPMKMQVEFYREKPPGF